MLMNVRRNLAQPTASVRTHLGASTVLAKKVTQAKAALVRQIYLIELVAYGRWLPQRGVHTERFDLTSFTGLPHTRVDWERGLAELYLAGERRKYA